MNDMLKLFLYNSHAHRLRHINIRCVEEKDGNINTQHLTIPISWGWTYFTHFVVVSEHVPFMTQLTPEQCWTCGMNPLHCGKAAYNF